MNETLQRYRALVARDARFDGVFFVGVTSTGIYCRPICPAKTPKRANCRFLDTAQLAERAGFRPCLRCRPELAPGSAPVDDAQRVAQLVIQRLDEGHLDGVGGLEAVAAQFELGSRQLRRIIIKELGMPPLQLLLTRRLLRAKQLLTETRLSSTEVAFASGFSSLRRFNDAFRRQYGMPPTRLRARASSQAARTDGGATLTLQLAYRPPLDWTELLAFLAARALPGVEQVVDGTYARTVWLGRTAGWIQVSPHQTAHALNVELTHSLLPVLPLLLRRLRALFDLDARPDVIASHLARDPRLAGAVRANPGRRVPGAFDGFELAVRAILGQQVTVRAATAMAGRWARAFGAPVVTPFASLDRLAPTPEAIARCGVDAVARLGIFASRARCLIALAQAEAGGGLDLEDRCGRSPEAAIERLSAIPGIGPWTAQYIALRALRWPDAFPKEDAAIRAVLGGVSAREAEAASQPWRPWRGYAVMHLWAMSRAPRGRSPPRMVPSDA